MIAGYEALGLRVWPAAEQINVDGWIACLSEGTTRRTNSVQTFAPPHGNLDLGTRIETCEALYRERGLRPVFKITEASLPNELEVELGARGYAQADPTIVQEVSLPGAASVTGSEVTIQDAIDDTWYTVCLRLNGISSERTDGLRAVIERMPAPSALASIGRGADCVAQAVGAVADLRLYLCLIATAPNARGRGLARQIMEALFDWGAARGAHTAWLQVVAANAPALRLYDRLGFRECYRYWYRQPVG